MDNLYQPLDTTSYVTSLSVDDLPSLSHVSLSSYAVGKTIGDGVKKTVGYLNIADGYKVAVNTKPSPKHLHNMKKTFGWTWENV